MSVALLEKYTYVKYKTGEIENGSPPSLNVPDKTSVIISVVNVIGKGDLELVWRKISTCSIRHILLQV